MRIIEASREFGVVEAYQLTHNPEASNMKEAVGEIIEVADWCLFEDEQEGETKQILSLKTSEGAVATTNSSTFQREFKFIVELCAQYQEPLPLIAIKAGISKSGREFITCAMHARKDG